MRACAARRAPRPAQRAPTRRPDPDAYQGEQRGGRRQGSAWQSAHLGWEARPHLCWKGGLGSPRHGGQPSPEGLPGGGGTKPAGLQQQGRHQRQPLPGGSEPRAPPTTLAPARWRLQQLCPPELPPPQARARGRSLASSGRGRAAHSEWDSWACPADTSHLQPVPRVGAREQRHALSRGQSSRGHPAEARARLGPAVLDPASRPWVTQVLSKVPPSSAASAVNRRSRFRTKQMSCDVPATAIFHTDTQEKCFIYILPSKEFEQQH